MIHAIFVIPVNQKQVHQTKNDPFLILPKNITPISIHNPLKNGYFSDFRSNFSPTP